MGGIEPPSGSFLGKNFYERIPYCYGKVLPDTCHGRYRTLRPSKLGGITPAGSLTSIERPMPPEKPEGLHYATASAGRAAKDRNKFALIRLQAFYECSCVLGPIFAASCSHRSRSSPLEVWFVPSEAVVSKLLVCCLYQQLSPEKFTA